MANDSKKYVSLNRLSNFLENIKGKYSQIGHKHTIADVTDYKIDTALSSTSTNPVQNKVLDAEFEAMATAMGALELAIDAKSDSTHNHDGRYYTESEIDSKLEDKASATHNHDDKYDAKGAAAAVQTNLNAVSDTLNAHTGDSDIHVTVANKSDWNAAHTHSTSAHARTDATKTAKSSTNGNILINGTETKVYSHPNSGVTAGTYKSVTVNAQGHVTAGTNPTTLAGYGITDAETKGAANTALASAKEYTDTVASGKSNTNHNHDSAYDAKGAASSALASAKSYADSAATTAANTVKNDLLNNAGAAYDTLKELGDLIDDNKDAIDALNDVAAGKANAVHTHAISDVTNLQSALDGKADKSHGTHVTYSTTAPVMDGTASVGTASTVARSDHKHPTDTSRASKTEFDTHTGNTTVHITSTERTNWNAAKTHADSAHAPSNAEKNQNAFSNIKVGSTTVAADTATDTLTLVAGTNVTITPDATNDKITISATDTNTTYSAGTGISLSGTTFSNSGVRSIATGSSNGTISVNTNGTTADVAVKGLGSAAYKATSAFDAAGAANTALTNAKTYTDEVAEGKADKSQAVFYVEGSGTTDTTNKVATWTGSHSDISEYYAGLMIAYKVGTAGSTTTTLNINNLGAVNVVKNASTAVSTSFPVNSVVLLVYTVDGTTAYWKAHDYDANTRNTVGDYQKNGTKLYFVGTTTTDSATSSSYATSYTNSNIYVDTSNLLNSAQGFKGKLVGNADTATSATSATKATQDASGNVITSTYETKTDATAKLTEAKTYTDEIAATKAASSHNHAASNITSGTLSSDRLPTVPIAKGGTGATTAAAALTNLGITATAAELNKLDGVTATTAELNYVDGVTSNVQTQLDGKAGKKVEGQTITVDDVAYVGGVNAEIFNDYEANIATGAYSHAEGCYNKASGDYSHAEGAATISSGYAGHAEGYQTNASGSASHAEGKNTAAIGQCTHAEGSGSTAVPNTITSSSSISTVETAWNSAKFTLAKGTGSHAEGSNTLALNTADHSEGYETVAKGGYSHAQGYKTKATGGRTHAEGQGSTASGNDSHAEGTYTIAAGESQHVQGKYNIEDTAGKYAHIVGGGSSASNRSNAHTLDWSGNAWFKGDIYVGGSGQDDTNASKLITEAYQFITVEDIDAICGATV